MTCIVVVALLILAHIISDFYLQTSRMAREKNLSSYALLQHTIIGMGTAVILTLPYGNFSLLKVIAVLGLLHLIVDKSRAEFDKRHCRQRFESLLVDQMLHLLAIILSYPWLKGITPNLAIVDGIARYFWFVNYYPEIKQISESQLIVAITIICAVLINIRGVNFIVRLAIEKYGPDKPPDMYISSEFIGRLERSIILIFVLLESYNAIGLVFAAKSIARLKEFENRDFTQYYIIGTLASTLAAIVTGLCVKGVIILLR
ncbi:MAG TPA: DUF3307 domain-containing protein [Methylomusa anaerophila]|uniref:DUF3307 domain-containing protein n=1 Tax=Methylomusa anaerophila TaxID=1930071 RepID=A0A348AHF0_9FIRM|nr:DUF3307 domain-containing protein [Methylomusa anaerophila]BBB90498.1 hypothetical protein MAMMFC1_01149 [Methylomusa anaerophila]HML89860.1 DUF3307 domain-containing protein [Methylomusa anaerophila]